MKKLFLELSFKIFNFIYKKQNEKHSKRMSDLKSKVLSGVYCDEKFHSNACATLTIKNNSNVKKNIDEKIKRILEEASGNVENIFNYIKNSKTPIYKIRYADKILSYIGEDEGFIYPKTGLKALYLNLILNKKISFNTPEMFVLRTFDVNLYAFIYQFYNWYCFKAEISGYETQTQENFKHVFEICETSKINTLSFAEVLNLKTAVKRDIDAIDFVINFVKEKSVAKENLEKIKQGKKIRI